MALHWKRQEVDDNPHKLYRDTDYTDDVELLTNTQSQAESLMHSLEQAAGSIGLHVNPDKTEYKWFHKKGGTLWH